MNRKEFFKNGLNKLFTISDEVLKNYSKDLTSSTLKYSIKKEKTKILEKKNFKKINNKLKSPPGAITPSKKFIQACTSCGKCINSCEFNVLFPVYDEKIKRNIPKMDLNQNPCRMCSDWPCIDVCEDNALVMLPLSRLKLSKPKLLNNYCINFPFSGESNCSVCMESCPIEGAITLKNYKPKFLESCTGCGLCKESCPPFPKAIQLN